MSAAKRRQRPHFRVGYCIGMQPLQLVQNHVALAAAVLCAPDASLARKCAWHEQNLLMWMQLRDERLVVGDNLLCFTSATCDVVDVAADVIQLCWDCGPATWARWAAGIVAEELDFGPQFPTQNGCHTGVVLE